MMEITAALTGARLAANMLGRILRPGADSSSPDAAAILQNQSEVPVAATGEAGDTLREIVGRYDLTDISPGEVSSLIHELHQAGLIDDQQYHELSLIRLDLDSAGVDQDKKINLLDFYGDKLNELTGSAAGMTGEDIATKVEPTQRIYNWLQKVALMQSSSADTSLLDTMA